MRPSARSLGWVVGLPFLLSLIPATVLADPTPGLPDLRRPARIEFFVPVRWCVVSGNSAEVAGRSERRITDEALWSRHERISDGIFIPQARLSFRSSVIWSAIESGDLHFPVIKDPALPGETIEGDFRKAPTGSLCNKFSPSVMTAEGDLTLGEVDIVINECQKAWEALGEKARKLGLKDMSASGVMVIAARKLISFERKGVRECLSENPFYAEGKVVVEDNQSVFSPLVDTLERGLGHEMAHALSLGHAEDDSRVPRTTEGVCRNLMYNGGLEDLCKDVSSGVKLEPFQIELIRGSLLARSGYVFEILLDPPALVHPGPLRADLVPDSLLDLTPSRSPLNLAALLVRRDEETHTLTFDHHLWGPVPPRAGNLSYFTLVDTDGNPDTGGQAAHFSSLGLAGVPFRGAELVLRVQAEIDDVEFGTQTFTPTVWRFLAGSFSEVIDPSIQAFHESQVATDGFPLTASRVSLRLAESLAGPLVEPFALQAATQDRNGIADVLDERREEGGGEASLQRPVFPTCSVAPDPVQRGSAAVVTAQGLVPNRPVHVILGADRIANGIADGAGIASVPFEIPRDSETGLRLVTVGTRGTALTADCGLDVVLPPDCNGNGVDDALDIAEGTSQDLNANDNPDECDLGTVDWIFEGTAQGGQISTTIQGFFAPCAVVLLTSPGQSAAAVAANFAAAINADACLAAQNVTAVVVGASTVRLRGFTLEPGDVTYTSTDSGLSHRMPLSVPALSPAGAALLVLLLAASAVFLLARRPGCSIVKPESRKDSRGAGRRRPASGPENQGPANR